jgi:chemotaxis protein MotA
VDPATLIGILLALGALFGSMIMEGGNPASIMLVPPMILVFFGTFGVAMACGMMRDATGAMGAAKRALFSKKHAADNSIATVVELAERARREGLLVLEEAAKTIDDVFLKKGIELAVDGTDPEELREILEAEVAAKRAADKSGAKFFADMGGFAPTLGILGTVLGLVHVLENLSEPSKLGHLIAGAFVATLWGVMSANVFWLPLSNKLKRMSELEVHQMELILEGILSIQAGANPRVIEQKLLSFLDPKDRPADEKAA